MVAKLLLMLVLACLACAARGADVSFPEVRIYDTNPEHLWNRLHRTLFVRMGPDGVAYGQDRPDPLFWGATKHLLAEPSHQEALRILDEFLRVHGERQVRDPLQRAFLQHDLWAVFDWSVRPGRTEYAQQRTELQRRLARIIRLLALSDQERASLPDNMARVEVFDEESEWVRLTVDGGAAPSHFQHFNGRSTFHPLLRMPGGRAATLAWLERLNSFESPWIHSPNQSGEQIVMNPALPQFPAGTHWALVRRMNVVDPACNILQTSFVESIQIRRYPALDAQESAMYVASRARRGELREVAPGERDFIQFRSHDGDPFEIPPGAYPGQADPFHRVTQRDVLRGCFGCHAGVGIFSVQSLARITSDRHLTAPKLSAAGPEEELPLSLYWPSYSLGLLRGLWDVTGARNADD